MLVSSTTSGTLALVLLFNSNGGRQTSESMLGKVDIPTQNDQENTEKFAI